MGYLSWANRKVKRLDVWQVGALKVCCILLGMIAGSLVPDFVRMNLWWFIISAGVLSGWLVLAMFSGRADRT